MVRINRYCMIVFLASAWSVVFMFTVSARGFSYNDTNKQFQGALKQGHYGPQSMSSPNGTCLVARAMPCTLPPSDAGICIADKLNTMSVNDKPTETNSIKKKNKRLVDDISPADFVTLQTLRSSALARKTNTTSKNNRGGAVLFSDLINNRDRKKDDVRNGQCFTPYF